MHRLEGQPPEAAFSQAATALGQRFIQRWDMYPRQLGDGRYICVREPLGETLLVAHLRGQITLGVYLLDQDSQVRFVVFDDDTSAGLPRLAGTAQALHSEGLPSYLEHSRRGGH